MRNIGSTRGNILQKNRPTIGFIIPEVGTQVNSQIWAGAVDAARALDVNLIGFAGYELQRPDAFKAQGNVIYDLICTENVVGLVLWTNALSNYAGPEAARKLYERFPAVPMVELEVLTSLTENYSYRAMGALIRHLIERHAYRQIAFIRGPAGHQEAEHRYQAYRDILQTAQLPADPERVVLADDWFEPSGKKAIQILLDQRHATFDAVVAANDLLAMGAIQELQERSIRVPNNVAVAGFDDIIDAQYYAPPLTTVRYPLSEMGWQAIEALASEIAGEIFERSPSLVQLRIRQSCGCLPSSVTQAAAGEVAVIGEPFESAFAARRETLLTEIQGISGNTRVTFEWTERLVDAVASEIKGDLCGKFIAILNDVLDQAIKADGNVADWQEVISVLYHQVLPCLEDRRNIVRAEDMWQQARVLIGEATTRAQMSQAVKKEQQTHILFKIVDRLNTAFDVERLMDILVEELPRLEIPSCYLSLYKDPQAPTDMARLILAYTDQGRMTLGASGQPFPAKHLVPAQFLPQDRQYALLLQDLYFHEQQMGFVLFEVSSRWKMFTRRYVGRSVVHYKVRSWYNVFRNMHTNWPQLTRKSAVSTTNSKRKTCV
jgi:sigma-B regulation protein RsbU (phosphoserine phosphatase)